MFKNYIKIAFRNLRRHKGYSFINIAGLAIGMVCCILILLYIQDELSYDRYPEYADQIYRLVLDVDTPNRGSIRNARTPPPWAPALADDYPEVESYVRFKTPLVSWLIGYEEGEKRFHESGFYFSDHTVFDFFNLHLMRGDPKTALRDPRTVVITETMAKKYFGDEDPMGKILRADNTYDFRITGIMQDVPKRSHIRFDFLASFESLSVFPIYGGTEYATFQRTGLFPDVYTYLRLKKDYPPVEFEKKMPDFLDKYLRDQIARLNLRVKPYLQPLTRIHLHSHLEAELRANSDISYIYIFSAIALFVLLIACINFMNLATAYSTNRAQEVGMRKVAGAYRIQLISQFLGESIFLAFLALGLALVLAQLLMPIFNSFSGKELVLTFGDSWVVLGIIAIVLFVGVVSGGYPAFFLSTFQPITVFKGSYKGSATNSLLRKILVWFQFTLSILFIISTIVAYKQMNYIQIKHLGFDKEQVVVIPLGDPRARQIYLSYKNLILQNPDVLSTTASSSLPGGLINGLLIRLEGAPEGEEINIEQIMVDHDFINTLGIELVEGRDFSVSFSTDTMSAFILNETAIRQFGWEQNPLGRQMAIGNWKQGKVIGIVKDFHVKSLHQRIEPLLIHIAPNPDALHYFAIRIRPNNISRILRFMEETWYQVYPHDPFIYSFLDEDFDSLYRAEELRGRILTSFTLLAIFIACLGLLGLASFSAEQRTKEIGIRKVLGASSSGLMILILKEFLILISIANITAWPVAGLLMHSWLQEFAYRTNIGISTFLFSGILSLIIALVTVSYQAIKAALANPVESLRYE